MNPTILQRSGDLTLDTDGNIYEDGEQTLIKFGANIEIPWQSLPDDPRSLDGQETLNDLLTLMYVWRQRKIRGSSTQNG
jgi:type IV secretory pathway VirB9-like protein